MKHLTLAALFALGLFASLNANAANGIYDPLPLINQSYRVIDGSGNSTYCRQSGSNVYCM